MRRARRRVAEKGLGSQFVTFVRREVAGQNPEIDIYPLVVWWSPVTQRYEDRLITRYRRGLSWRWLSRLVIDYGGDVIAYQSPARRGAPTTVASAGGWPARWRSSPSRP